MMRIDSLLDVAVRAVPRYRIEMEKAENAQRRLLSSLSLGAASHAGAVRAAEILCETGVVRRLLHVVEDVEEHQRTVWFLGRDADVLFLLGVLAGHGSVRYLHGFSREFVRKHSRLACHIARAVVSPGDVVVDTGYDGSCVWPFHRAGARGVLVSSTLLARDWYLCLDERLSYRGEEMVREAVRIIERFSVSEEEHCRANYVVLRRWIPEERWLARTEGHIRFVSSFLRTAVDALVSMEARWRYHERIWRPGFVTYKEEVQQ